MGDNITQIAACPSAVRYPDGPYQIRATVTDVRNAEHHSDPVDITIDNFPPFLQSIQASIANQTVYQMAWTCDDQCEGTGGIQATGPGAIAVDLSPSDLTSGISVQVHSSEALQTLTMALNAFDVDLPPANITLQNVSDDRLDWTFHVQVQNYVLPYPTGNYDDLQFTFTGTDYPANGTVGNALLDLSEYYHPYAEGQADQCVRLPTRNATGWTNPENVPSGSERAHHFGFRIAENTCHQDAIYEDGPYTDPIAITLDNFKPYLEMVQVFIGDQEVYFMEWSCNNDCAGNSRGGILPEGGIIPADITEDHIKQGMLVIVNASEALQELTLGVRILGDDLPAANVYNSMATNEKTWLFEVDIADYLEAGTLDGEGDLVDLSFSGLDYPRDNLPANALLNLAAYYHPDNPALNHQCVLIPFRNGPGVGDWQDPNLIPTGTELAHHFGVICGGAGGGNFNAHQPVPPQISFSGSCLAADFSFDLAYDGCSAHFTDQSLGQVSSWEWRFGDGSISTEPQPSHAFPQSDCYPVTLTVEDEGGQQNSYTQEVCISGCDGDYTEHGQFNVQLNGPTSVYLNSTQNQYRAQVAGGVAPYEYWWQVREVDAQGQDAGHSLCGEVASQGSAETSIRIIGNQCHGTKLILLTVTDAYDRVVQAQLPIQIVGPQPSCAMEVTGNPTVGATVQMRILGSIVGSDCYDVYPYWTWDYGDGSTPEQLFWITEHVYQSPGPYQIRATGCREPYQTAGDCVTVLGQVLIENGTTAPPGPTFDIEPAGVIQAQIGTALETPLSVKVNDLPQNTTTLHHGQYAVRWEVLDADTGELLNGINLIVPYADLETGILDDYNFVPTADHWGCLDVRLTISPIGYYAGYFDLNPADGCGAQEAYGTVGGCLGCPDPGQGWVNLGEENAITGTAQRGHLTGCPYPYPAIERACKIEVAYDPLEVTDIALGTGCNPELTAVAKKGARQSNPGPCGSQAYADYSWTAYDIRQTDQVLEGLLESDQAACASINVAHPYLANFAGDGLLLFLAKVVVTDHFGVKDSLSKVISLAPPLRLAVAPQISRCPGTTTPLTTDPLATGGDGYYTYTWPVHANLLTDPDHPEQRLLRVEEQAFSFTLTVTDGQQCSRSQTILVQPQPLQADAGPSYVRACANGPGLYRLGPDDPEQAATGGSGEYTYDWQPAEWIAGPNDVTNPLPRTDGSNWKIYTLTLSDAFGCTTQDHITLIPTSGSPVAEAGSDQTICYGSPTSIGTGQAQSGYDYIWTSNNPRFKGSETATAILQRVHNRGAGTFDYTLRAVHRLSGCYDEDVVRVQVREQWLYRGYESQVRWTEDGAIDLWATSQNTIIPSTNPNYSSGASPPLHYQWLPDTDGLQQVQYGTQGIPEDGRWYPYPTNNYKTLLVSDAHNCSRRFKTNKGILIGQSPHLDLTLLDAHGGSPNPQICGTNDAELCFKLDLRTFVDTDYPQYLPPNLTLNYVWRKSVGTVEQEVVEQGSVELQLRDGQTGHYEAIKCIGPFNYTDWLSSWSDFTVTGDLNNNGYVSDTWLNAVHEFQVGVVQDNIQAYYELCGTWTQDAGVAAGTLYVGEKHGCNTFRVEPNVRATLRGAGTEGLIYLLPNTQGPAGSHLLAYIDECLRVQTPLEPSATPDDLLAPTLSESTDSRLPEVDFKLYPNPFADRLDIHYQIGADHRVGLQVTDLTGRLQGTVLPEQTQSAGQYHYRIKGNDLAPGIYFIHLWLDGIPVISQRIIKLDYQ